MEKKEKQKYIKGIIFNSFFIFIFLLFIYAYALGQYEDIGNNSLLGNTLNNDLNRINNNGYIVDEVQNKFIEANFNDTKNIFSDKNKVELAIKKPSSYKKSYSEWIDDEISKIDFYNSEIEKNKFILGNIIPSFPDYSIGTSTGTNDKLTLETFIKYIEDNILKEYNIESFSPIGIDNVTFEGAKNISNIGSFKLNLDFSGKNNNILKFINNIQNSGKITIENGRLKGRTFSTNETVSNLNNLLITIEDLKLENNLISRDNEDNKGNIVLKFYIRGMGIEDYLLIKNKIGKDLNILYSNILNDSKLCDKGLNQICTNNDGNKAVSDIRSLISQVTAVKQKFDEQSKNKVEDPSREAESLYQLYITIQSLDNIYSENKQIINNFSKGKK